MGEQSKATGNKRKASAFSGTIIFGAVLGVAGYIQGVCSIVPVILSTVLLGSTSMALGITNILWGKF